MYVHMKIERLSVSPREIEKLFINSTFLISIYLHKATNSSIRNTDLAQGDLPSGKAGSE